MAFEEVDGAHGRPLWQENSESPNCTKCARPFNMIYRRHHCRGCGKLVCDKCSPHRMELPATYSYPPGKHRTCEGCYSTLVALQYEHSLLAGVVKPPDFGSIHHELMERVAKYASLAPDGWLPTRHIDSVAVSTRPVEGHLVDCVRSEVLIRAPPAKVISVYQDMELWRKWNPHMSSRVVELLDEKSKVVSASYQFPVIDRRDSCFYTTVVEDGPLVDAKTNVALATGAMSIVHPLCPQEAGVVRAVMWVSITILEAVEEGKATKLSSIVHSDPRGLLPPWLVNRVLARGAQHLRGMADYVESLP